MYDIITEFDLIRKFKVELNSKLEQAINDAGYEAANLEFVKNNFSFIEFEDDDFVHLYFRYGKEDQKRIISYEKLINQQIINNENNSISCEISVKYY